tara:strand:+ start:2148 stop:2807 length:660 start_codon:yes stop_codon:yes gene_type:complete
LKKVIFSDTFNYQEEILYAMFGVDIFNYGHIIGSNPTMKKSAEGDLDSFAEGDKVKLAQYCLSDSEFSEGWVETVDEGTHLVGEVMMNDTSAIYVPEGQSVILRKFESANIGEDGVDEASQDPQVEHSLVGPITIECMTDIGGGTNFNDQLEEIEVKAMPTCASMNREDGVSAYDCGACKVGYSEDADGVCQKETGIDPQFITYGIIGLIGLTAISLLR